MPGIDLRRLVGVLSVLLVCGSGNGRSATDLVELYARARESDPVFRAARQEQLIAEEVLRESWTAVRPIISASGEFSKTFQDIAESENILFPEGRTDFFNQRFSISLAQPIYRNNAFSRIPQARAEARQAAWVFAAAEQDLIYRLAQAHLTFLAASDNLNFASAEHMAIRRQLLETEERLTSGLAPITDLHDARARFALAEASEIDARNGLEESRQAIAEIVGKLPADLALLSETFPLVEPDRPDVEAWVEAALFQNPNVKALEAVVQVAEREIRRQRGTRRPALDLVVSFTGSDTGGTIFGGGNEIATTDIALRVDVPIFDGGRASSLARNATLRYRIRLEELERQKRRVEQETRTAFHAVVSGITRVKALEQSVFSHEAALAQREEGVRSGLNTGLEVLDARRNLFLAKRDLTQARYVYILNSLRLKQSTGILSVDDLRAINAYLQ